MGVIARKDLKTTMNTHLRSHEPFVYEGFVLDSSSPTLTCRYAIGEWSFVETFFFPGVDPNGEAWRSAPVNEAARLIFLLAGVSYYKTFAPKRIELPRHSLTEAEHAFLNRFYISGLGEFAYRNQFDLSDIEIVAERKTQDSVAAYIPTSSPLIPFGGGIDSVVTVEEVRKIKDGCRLFIMNKKNDVFAAIEDAANVSGLEVVRAQRTIDPSLYASGENGFFNGHVPVTGILSAVATMTAFLHGASDVVMSNEHSASTPTLVSDGVAINHQWSKSLEFEIAFASLIQSKVGDGFDYFSYLRDRSEVWVAQRFAQHSRYHEVFRSCNRSFALDPARRANTWCGECDKCCFIDLVLAPFVERDTLVKIFGGNEPLENSRLEKQFEILVGVDSDPRPFECIGDEVECQLSATQAALRDDRADSQFLRSLSQRIGWSENSREEVLRAQLETMGPSTLPSSYQRSER
jgi:hypothetical protein